LQELEKILEEINGLIEKHKNKAYELVAREPLTQCYAETDIEQIKVHELAVVRDIIRKHMDNHSGDTNEMVGKWIPVEDTEHTPENESYVLVSFSNSSLPDIARYEENEEGGTYYPGDDEESYLKYGLFVNAWQPLPKPYRPDPCHGCFGAANNDCRNCDKI